MNNQDGIWEKGERHEYGYDPNILDKIERNQSQDFIDKSVEKFNDTLMVKYYGACFECCDFEEITNKYSEFLRQQLQEAIEFGRKIEWEKAKDIISRM